MRHRFHSICPYFAMFPETFVEKHLCLAPTDGVILDPFSGRWTTVFQTLLSGRTGLGIDTNPLAACISRAKADAPVEMEVTSRIEEIESKFKPVEEHLLHDPFFVACFHRETSVIPSFFKLGVSALRVRSQVAKVCHADVFPRAKRRSGLG